MNAHPDSPGKIDHAEAEQTAFGPAANALKHGYCATRIVDTELRLRAEEFLKQLRQIHDPWSPEESESVDELAQTLARLERLETAMDALVAGEKARARELHDRRALDAFTSDLARFRSEPANQLHILGQSRHGADWLEKLWNRVESALRPAMNPTEYEPVQASLSFRLACDAANAMGGPWQVDQAEGGSAWFMARYVRVSPEPEESLEAWIKASNAPDGPKTAQALAKRLVADAPADPAQALAEMVTKAASERMRWELQANSLRSNYETEAARAADLAVGTGVGDPGLEKRFRLLSRYLTSTRNRADRLRRRLDALKKHRKSFAWRTQQAAEREARQLRKDSEAARKRCDAELARAGSQPFAWSAARIAPVQEDCSGYSRNEEIVWSAVECGSADPSVASIAPCPAASDFIPESMQMDEESVDAVELRNGIPADSMAESLTGFDIDEFEAKAPADPKFEADRRILLALPRDRSTFKDRFKLCRCRNWADSAEVMPDEAEILRQLMALPESFERTFTIHALFGSIDTFRRCWKSYANWAEPDLVEAAESANRASLK